MWFALSSEKVTIMNTDHCSIELETEKVYNVYLKNGESYEKLPFYEYDVMGNELSFFKGNILSIYEIFHISLDEVEMIIEQEDD